jgi:hypothetical protein
VGFERFPNRGAIQFTRDKASVLVQQMLDIFGGTVSQQLDSKCSNTAIQERPNGFGSTLCNPVVECVAAANIRVQRMFYSRTILESNVMSIAWPSTIGLVRTG